MSKLEQLIQQYCPNGVDYQPLGNVVNIIGGKDYKHLNSGNIPLYGSGGIMGYVDAASGYGPTVLLPRKGSISNVFFVEGPFWNVDTIFSTEINQEKILPRYFYHVILNEHIERLNTSNAARPSLTRTVLNKIEIPVPPLPVQEEIVRILDSFTELEARRGQYAYYRDGLLDFSSESPFAELHQEWCPDGVPFLSLGELALWTGAGGTPKKSHQEYYDSGDIPWLRTGQVNFNIINAVEGHITQEGLDNSSAQWIPSNCVIVAISGATAGRCAINAIPTTTNQHCFNIEVESSKALYKYVFYCVCAKYQELLSMKQGARGDLNGKLIKSLKIPVPPLNIQKRIVDILDSFDLLVNESDESIPAEIEARRQQYAYYRDALFSFKRMDEGTGQ